MKLITTTLLVVALSACATRTPPPDPKGDFRPINGQEQHGMATPNTAIESPCFSGRKPHRCKANTP